MIANKRRVTLSDGTEVEIRAPGIGFELEAHGSIPGFGLLVERVRAGGEDAVPGGMDVILRSGALLIVHGAVSPRFTLDGKNGGRPVGELLPPDFDMLARAIGDLRREVLEAAAETLRPTPAGGT